VIAGSERLLPTALSTVPDPIPGSDLGTKDAGPRSTTSGVAPGPDALGGDCPQVKPEPCPADRGAAVLRERLSIGRLQPFERLLRRSNPLSEAACRRLTLVATVLGSSMASVTAISVALPAIRTDFGIGFGAQQWIMLSYSLALASLYLVAGALDDRLGRRRMFIAGTAGFAPASSLGGIAPNAAVLIVARILQGAAGALLTTGSLSLLRSTFGTQSGRAIGIWATGTGAVSLGGPPLGGALVEWASWRWIFFLNVPLAIVAISLAWVAHRGITRPAAPRSKLDVLGAGLVALGIGSLTYGLVQGGRAGICRGGVGVSARRC
jgi:MFS family permease